MIVGLGIVGGIGAGIWMGKGMSNIYMGFYSLPFMIYVLKPQVIAAATLITMAVAILGTLYAVRNAARLPPAQAMRPEQPAIYRATIIERLGLQHWFSQPTRMILRHIERRPVEIPVNHTRYSDGLRCNDDRWLSGGRYRSHGRGAVWYESARRPYCHLYRADFAACALFAAQSAGRGACGRGPQCARQVTV